MYLDFSVIDNQCFMSLAILFKVHTVHNNQSIKKEINLRHTAKRFVFGVIDSHFICLTGL